MQHIGREVPCVALVQNNAVYTHILILLPLPALQYIHQRLYVETVAPVRTLARLPTFVLLATSSAVNHLRHLDLHIATWKLVRVVAPWGRLQPFFLPKPCRHLALLLAPLLAHACVGRLAGARLELLALAGVLLAAVAEPPEAHGEDGNRYAYGKANNEAEVVVVSSGEVADAGSHAVLGAC